MSASAASNLAMTLLEMESDIRHVQAWADAFKAMGEGSNLIEPASVLVMGNALDTLASVLHDRWEAANKLAVR